MDDLDIFTLQSKQLKKRLRLLQKKRKAVQQKRLRLDKRYIMLTTKIARVRAKMGQHDLMRYLT